MKKKLPKFSSDEEAEAFLEQDISDYIHAGNFQRIRFEILPKDTNVNLRLPVPLLETVKARAKQEGIPYQRFIRLALERSLNAP